MHVDLKDCTQLGYFYGSSSPHNHGKDLQSITAPLSDTVDYSYATIESFKKIANLHGKFWSCNFQNELVQGLEFLRGSLWMKDNTSGQMLFQASQEFAINAWKNVCAKIADGKSQLRFDQRLVDVINASFSKVSWDDFKASFEEIPYTVIHGDFHPANVMIHNETRELFILDWEMVGIGRGGQDLGQFTISHLAPEDRRQVEDKALDAYYDSLMIAAQGRINVEKYTKEFLKNEYVIGGFSR